MGVDGHVLGIDLSPAMVELTAEELRRDGLVNAEVRVGDAEHLDLSDGSFDVVTCGFAVFHFPAPVVAMAESRRVLRGGGRFAASTFADRTLDYPWLREVAEQVGLMGEMQHRFGTRPMLGAGELSQILADAGFDRVVMTTSERRFVFADVEAYMRWVRTQGFGVFVNRLDERDLQRFREGCAERLNDHRAADGYELLKRVDLTVAHRD